MRTKTFVINQVTVSGLYLHPLLDQTTSTHIAQFKKCNKILEYFNYHIRRFNSLSPVDFP